MLVLSSRRRTETKVAVIIPALNEEGAISLVLADIPRDRAAEVIVVDNGSTDRTAEVAQAAGARVVGEPRRGRCPGGRRGDPILPFIMSNCCGKLSWPALSG
jgi:cellulose synthase/poly-beta-1,6-N-acetylglucosamine synthase-like glycosyltransferase